MKFISFVLLSFILLYCISIKVNKNKKIKKWNSSPIADQNVPGPVLAPYKNSGPDKHGIQINNNYWKSSDLNPINNERMSNVALIEKSREKFKMNIAQQNNQPKFPKPTKDNFNYNYSKDANGETNLREKNANSFSSMSSSSFGNKLAGDYGTGCKSGAR